MLFMKKQTIYVIAGPTASGKSKLALNLAEKIGGEIINADAFQVYQGLSILTARPTEAQMQGIPHHLYGYMDNYSQENVHGWIKKVAETIPNVKNPIVVGGTGLYLSVLNDGISPIPTISEEIRQKVRMMDPKEVLAKLTQGVVPKDIQRQKRALEVFLETGHPIDYFQSLPKQKIIHAEFKNILILPKREELYNRIEERLIQMLQGGIVQEVQNLLNSTPTGGVLKAIGVKELTDFIEKKCDLPTALKNILLATKHYAKRQKTWFRHQMPHNTQTIESADMWNVITK